MLEKVVAFAVDRRDSPRIINDYIRTFHFLAISVLKGKLSKIGLYYLSSEYKVFI